MSFIDSAAAGLRAFADKLKGTAKAPETPQATPQHDPSTYRPNRKDRRAADHKRRQRTRRTGISQREPARYGWAIHNDANNKALQFVNHGLLHSLFGKANVWSKPE